MKDTEPRIFARMKAVTGPSIKGRPLRGVGKTGAFQYKVGRKGHAHNICTMHIDNGPINNYMRRAHIFRASAAAHTKWQRDETL